MNTNYVWVAVVVVAIIAILGLFSPEGGRTVIERVIKGDDSTGAIVGPDVYDNMRFHQNIAEGGSRATSTTGSAVTLTSAEIDREVNYLTVTPGDSVTATTMASTSAPLNTLKVGESFDLYVYNASSTGTTITYAAGTGVDLQEDEGETVVQNGAEIARLTFVKKADTDVALWVEVGQAGD